MSTEIQQFLADLNGGVFEQQVSQALSDVASGVVLHGKAGQVVIKLDLSRISESSQVKIKHKLEFNKPTSKGSVREDLTTETPMHVGKQGKLSLFPENQHDLFPRNQPA
tara:strand:+ start:35 stop:361 length:327 start_codon:yes stop_codon:yes gene_type:complete